MESKESVVAVMPSSTAQTDAEIEMSKGISVVEEQAKGIVIETQEDYAQAAEMGKLIKQKAAEITDFFAPMKKAAHDTHKNICDRCLHYGAREEETRRRGEAQKTCARRVRAKTQRSHRP